MVASRGKMRGRDREGVWDGHVHTAISKTDLLYSTGNCSMSCGSLDGRGVWGRMDTCICTAESLCCPAETITTLLIGYTPVLWLPDVKS